MYSKAESQYYVDERIGPVRNARYTENDYINNLLSDVTDSKLVGHIQYPLTIRHIISF